MAKQNNIYTDHIDSITRIAHDKEYEDIVNEMVTRSEGTAISTVVLFCSLQHAQGLTKATHKVQKASKFVWVVSDSFDTTALDQNNICILTIQLTEEGLSSSFREYFNDLNMQDPKWKKHGTLVGFWEDWFKCRVGNASSSSYAPCTGAESLHNVSESFTLQPIMSAVFAFAHGIDSLQKELCGNQSGICPSMMSFKRERLLQHLRNVSFENFLNTSLNFNKNGEVMAKYQIFNFQQVGAQKSFKLVGEWDGEKSGNKLLLNVKDIMWFNTGNGSIPRSYCSAECNLGYVKREREGYSFDYCWKCHKCDKLQLIANNTCISGRPGYIPNVERDKWIKRELLHLRWSDTISIAIAIVSGVAIILTLAVLFVFLTYHNNRTVKASGRELSCIILTGILLCFIIPFTFIAKPTNLICYARNVVPGVALSVIYSALFMKINRVYRVFTRGRISKRRPPLVRPKSQILISFGLISIEILITLLGQLAHFTTASEIYYSDTEQLILECDIQPTTYVGSISYVVVLMLLSTVYAFKTRKFPRNFNESKYIGFTLYTTLATFTIFFAFYLNTSYSVAASALTAIGVLVTGLITLIGLFSQRLIVIFFVKEVRAEDTMMTRHRSSGEISRSPVVMNEHGKTTPVSETRAHQTSDPQPGRSTPT